MEEIVRTSFEAYSRPRSDEEYERTARHNADYEYCVVFQSSNLCETLVAAVGRGYAPCNFMQTMCAGNSGHLKLKNQNLPGFARITSENGPDVHNPADGSELLAYMILTYKLYVPVEHLK